MVITIIDKMFFEERTYTHQQFVDAFFEVDLPCYFEVKCYPDCTMEDFQDACIDYACDKYLDSFPYEYLREGERYVFYHDNFWWLGEQAQYDQLFEIVKHELNTAECIVGLVYGMGR